MVDVIQKRLDLALKLGAKRVINGKEQDTVAVLRSPEMYGDHGIDLVFEAAGGNIYSTAGSAACGTRRKDYDGRDTVQTGTDRLPENQS